jgi:hypothetical protein
MYAPCCFSEAQAAHKALRKKKAAFEPLLLLLSTFGLKEVIPSSQVCRSIPVEYDMQ